MKRHGHGGTPSFRLFAMKYEAAVTGSVWVCSCACVCVCVQWYSSFGLPGHHAAFPSERGSSQEQYLLQATWTNESFYSQGTESTIPKIIFSQILMQLSVCVRYIHSGESLLQKYLLTDLLLNICTSSS